jgi:hypothetical protein
MGPRPHHTPHGTPPLPQMEKLVAAVGAANPSTVVVMLGGAAMALSEAQACPAVLWMGLAGQAVRRLTCLDLTRLDLAWLGLA